MTQEIEKVIDDAFANKIKHINSMIEETKKDIESSKNDIEDYEAVIENLEAEKNELKSTLEKVESTAEDPLHIFKLTPEDSIKLDEADCKKANAWTLSHALRFHTAETLGIKSPRYKGAIGCADYMIRMGWTSIGRYVELVCTECEKVAARQKADTGEQTLEYKDYTYDIEEIG